MRTKSIIIQLSLLVCFTASASAIIGTSALSINHHGIYSVTSLADITNNLEFDFCKADVRSSSDKQLDNLASFLIAKKLAVSLRGHADGRGSYVGNWKMSDKRALAVKDYLMKKGVADDKIVTTPFGSTIPVASNRTAAGRQKNRRVEIRIDNPNL